MRRVTLLAASIVLAASFAQAATLRWSSQGDYLTADPMAQNELLTNSINGHVYESLVMRGKKLEILPGLATKWEQKDAKTWIFHLRRGVKFHDGTDFTADAVVWNLERYFNKDSPQFEPPASGISRARVPLMDSYKKIDDYTVSITTKTPASYFPYMAVYLLITSPISFEKAGREWSKVAALPAAQKPPSAPADRPITIKDAVTIFLQQNLQLVAARYDIDIVDAEKLTAGLRPNPEIEIGFSEGHTARTAWKISSG